MKHIKKTKLSAFLDGEVYGEEKAEILKHLKLCPHCRREAEKLSQVSDFLVFIEEVEVSPYFFVHLKRRITEQESRTLIRLPFIEWVRRVAIPVGAAALFIISFLLGSYITTAIFRERTTQASYLRQEFDNLLSMTSLDDFPEGSLGNAYTNLLTEGEER